MITVKDGKPADIRPDWKAYFLAFAEAHGGPPMKYRGVLLFSDGWTHSATDYAGPEWPPPEDPQELAGLVKLYWTWRRKQAEAEINSIDREVGAIKQVQALRSAPLQQTITYIKEKEDGTKVMARKAIDLDEVRELLALRRQALIFDIDQCDNKLEHAHGITKQEVAGT